MAVIIEQQYSKSFLILKHLEYPYFESLPKLVIDEILSHYNLLVYFGYYMKLERDLKYVDGYIAAPGVLELENSKIPRLYLNGFNFISSTFSEKREADKIIDFCFIGDVTPRKGLRDFLIALSELNDWVRSKNVLLLVRTNSNSLFYRVHKRKIVRILKERFDTSEISNLNLIFLDAGLGVKLTSNVVVELLRKSRCLILPSHGEGAARVFAEAKLMGLDTICNAKMKGGTLSKIFSNDKTYSNVRELGYLLENYQFKGASAEDKSEIRKTFLAEYNITSFKEFLASFNVDSCAADISLQFDEMYNLLSSHRIKLPREIVSNRRTDECLTMESMYRLSSYLLGKEVKYNSFRVRLISIRLVFLKYVKLVSLKFFRVKSVL